MRGYSVFFLVISFLSIVFGASCGGAPGEEKTFLFEQSHFAEPITLNMPKQVDQSQIDAEVKRGSVPSFLPILPMGGWVDPGVKEIEFLYQQGFIRLTALDYRCCGTKYFPVHTQKAKQYLVRRTGIFGFPGGIGVKIAQRRLKKITFTNSFEVVPSRRAPMTVHAFTFTYTLEELIPGFPDVAKEFVGKAEVFRDPADGEWKTRSLFLPDKGDREYTE